MHSNTNGFQKIDLICAAEKEAPGSKVQDMPAPKPSSSVSFTQNREQTLLKHIRQNLREQAAAGLIHPSHKRLLSPANTDLSCRDVFEPGLNRGHGFTPRA